MKPCPVSHKNRLVLYSQLGNALEYYDFSLYVFLSPILGRLFFPAADFYESIIYGYTTFFISFLARPIGGAIFALIGKRYGVGIVFNSTVALMGVATIILSILPEFKSIGWYAPLLLFCLRSLQCFSLAGEFVSSLVVTLGLQKKSTRENSVGNIVSAGTLGWLIGSVIASFTLELMNDVPALESILWRLPFLVGGIMSLILFSLRYQLFTSLKPGLSNVDADQIEQDHSEHLPNLGKKILTIVLAGWNGVLFYGLFIYPPINNALEYSTNGFTLGYSAMCILFYALALVVLGQQMDKISHAIKTYLLLLTFPAIYLSYYLLTESTFFAAMIFASVISSVTVAFVMIFTNAWIPYFFKSSKRFHNVSILYNLGVSICGGSTPLICAYLQNIGGNAWSYIYIAFFSLLCVMLIFCLRRVA